MLVLILAGGKSRRMGVDKALLTFNGRTLLDAAIVKYVSAGFEVAVSGHAAESVPVIIDFFPGCGPMAGLHAAFASHSAELIFLTAVDLPNVSSDLMHALADKMQPEHDACVILRGDGRAEPLFALYRRSCYSVADALLQSGEYKMRALLSQVNTRYVSEHELPGFDLGSLLTNVNTPEDYKALHQ